MKAAKPKSMNPLLAKNYRGYHQLQTSKIDEKIAFIEPGTLCGEYFRRYWHPVTLTSEVGKLPLPVRILGEDLILFKTTKGDI